MTHLSDVLNAANTRQLTTRRIAELAEREGHTVHYSTIARYLGGRHPIPPRYDVLEAFSAALRVPMSELEDAAEIPSRAERFELPAEADALNEQERQAVVQLVRVMAQSKHPNKAAGRVDLVTPKTTATIHQLHPERDHLDVAAYEGADEAWLRRREADAARGEESQESPYDD